jgi:hypothetical protein
MPESSKIARQEQNIKRVPCTKEQTDKSTNNSTGLVRPNIVVSRCRVLRDHNTVHNIHNIHNVTINCTPAQKDEIVSFLDTDLDAAVKLILIRRASTGASERKHHQELQATHFERSTTTGTS